jgi:hypothetical protein
MPNNKVGHAAGMGELVDDAGKPETSKVAPETVKE